MANSIFGPKDCFPAFLCRLKPRIPLENDMKRTRGLALILVAGILALLGVTSAAMLRMAAGLRIQAGVGADHIVARLLAVSGVEYGFARLFDDSSVPPEASVATQSDDWIYR